MSLTKALIARSIILTGLDYVINTDDLRGHAITGVTMSLGSHVTQNYIVPYFRGQPPFLLSHYFTGEPVTADELSRNLPRIAVTRTATLTLLDYVLHKSSFSQHLATGAAMSIGSVLSEVYLENPILGNFNTFQENINK